jgi:uncharacterized membrane protein required for colicin V production
MHVLDIILAVITAFLVFTGLRRGLIGEVIRLSAMVVGFFVAFLYYQDLGARPPFSIVPVQTPIRFALAFLVIYCLCAVVILAAGWLIKKIVHLTPLGWIDRLAGALIGFLKALLIAWVICLSISSLPVRRIKSDFNNSLVYRAFSALPKGLTLKSLLSNRARFRTMFTKKRPREIEKLQGQIDRVKEVFDPAKETPPSDTER